MSISVAPAGRLLRIKKALDREYDERDGGPPYVSAMDVQWLVDIAECAYLAAASAGTASPAIHESLYAISRELVDDLRETFEVAPK